jgi:hypothetical protein
VGVADVVVGVVVVVLVGVAIVAVVGEVVVGGDVVVSGVVVGLPPQEVTSTTEISITPISKDSSDLLISHPITILIDASSRPEI